MMLAVVVLMSMSMVPTRDFYIRLSLSLAINLSRSLQPGRRLSLFTSPAFRLRGQTSAPMHCVVMMHLRAAVFTCTSALSPWHRCTSGITRGDLPAGLQWQPRPAMQSPPRAPAVPSIRRPIRPGRSTAANSLSRPGLTPPLWDRGTSESFSAS
ncbi:hypothetical protein EDB80DRAFT_807235 [Ilyonectria destructans]|nr:hypothetical protein EDB80DRAFT_807235 [Ilyonectria destructans]